MSKNLIYAADFGTSNSLLAAASNSESVLPIELDSLGKDKSILRSLMYFPKHGEPSFGQSAIENYIEESGDGRFIRSIKKYLPVDSFSGTQINGTVYSLEELIGRFLREMKYRADIYFDADVEKIVLGRPAKFSAQEEKDRLAQSRLEEAAKQAGFKEISFFAEPLAAAYSYRKNLKEEKIVLVVDLGGGTSDFTVIKIGPNKHKPEDTLSIGGVSIAGDSLDGCIMSEKVSPHFGSKLTYKLPMSSNRLTMPPTLKAKLSSPADITLMGRSGIMSFLNEIRKARLKPSDEVYLEQLFSLITENLGFSVFEKIEEAKRELCTGEDHLFEYLEDEIDIEEKITNDEFVEITENKILSIFDCLDEVLKNAGISADKVDSICCTGGTSKVPAIKTGLLKRFGEEKIHSFKNFHSVINGLAERACELS